MSVTLENMLEEAEPAVRRVVRRGLRARPDLVEDAEQQAYLQLLERFERMRAGDGGSIESIPDYAARVAYNVVHDSVRPEDTTWSRLRNRARLFLSEQPQFAVWTHPAGDKVAGYRSWEGQFLEGSVASDRVARLTHDHSLLEERAYPQAHWERLTPEEWHTFFAGVFDYLEGPIPLNQLVGLTAELLGIQLGGVAKELDDLEKDSGEGPDRPGPRQPPSAYTVVHLKEQLRVLWECLQVLPREWMLATLLNPPSLRKDLRGEIAVFVSNGIASRDDFRQILALSPSDYSLLDCLPSAGEQSAETDDEDRFALLWRRIPIADTAVGKLLGKSGMQVIALRRLALRRLRRCRKEKLGA